MRNKKLDQLEGCSSEEGHLLSMTHRPRPAGSIRSRRDNESMRKDRCKLFVEALCSDKEVIFLYI